MKMAEDGVVIGIDVAKGWLDVAVLSTGESFRVGNDAQGWAALVQRLKGRRIKAIGVEPSGGYERRVAKVLHKAGLPVRNVNPYKLRNYARALGRSSMQEGNRFWRPGDLRKHLPDFRRVSGFLNYAGLDDYYRLYPFYLPYGAGSWRRAPSPSRKLYFGVVSRFGAATPYFLPSLAGIFERVGD